MFFVCFLTSSRCLIMETNWFVFPHMSWVCVLSVLNARHSSNPACLKSSVWCYLVAKFESGLFENHCMLKLLDNLRLRGLSMSSHLERPLMMHPFEYSSNNPKSLLSTIMSTAWRGNERSTTPCSSGKTNTMNRCMANNPCISSVCLPCSNLHRYDCCCLQSAPELDSAC